MQVITQKKITINGLDFQISQRLGVASFRQEVDLSTEGILSISSASVFCSGYSFLMYRGVYSVGDGVEAGSKMSVFSVQSKADVVPFDDSGVVSAKVVVSGNVTMIPYYDYGTQKNYMIGSDAWNNAQLDLCVVAIGQ